MMKDDLIPKMHLENRGEERQSYNRGWTDKRTKLAFLIHTMFQLFMIVKDSAPDFSVCVIITKKTYMFL